MPTNPDFILIILGEGEEKKLESMIIKKFTKKNLFTWFVDNVYNYFLRSEIFVLSSKWEEVGFVIVELLHKFICNIK